MKPLTQTLPLLLLLVGILALGACEKAETQDSPPKSGSKPGGGSATSGTALDEVFDRKSQPWAFVLPSMPAPVPIPGLRAEDCGKCHETIYKEWKGSTHSHALSDLQFQAELAKKDSPRWLCLNCHTPLEDQRARLTLGLEDGDVMKPVQTENPRFDPVLRAEAVTCAVCHVRMDAQGKSYIRGVYGSKHAPHPVRKDPERLRSICLRCHDPVGEPITKNLLCWFTTRKELVDGGGEATDCLTCHMPTKYRLLVESMPDLPIRKVHRHTWPGAGVPKTYEGYDPLLRSGWKSGLTIQTRRSGDKVIVTLFNGHAGHAVPTADPERFVQVRLRAFDKEGKQISEGKERIGQTWAWNPARKLGDNRIGPGEKRELSFTPAPSAARLVLDVLNVRLGKSTAEHMVKTKDLDEQLLPHANQLIKRLRHLYPFATYVYRATWDGDEAKVAEPKALIELSKKERSLPIADRSY